MYQLAVIGQPIQHSLSPTIHALFARQVNLNLEYSKQAIPVERLNDFLANEAPFLHGFNVTVPHKEAVFSYLSNHGFRSAPLCQQSQATNTVDIAQKMLFNTDGIGLINDLRQRCLIGLKHRKILILGCGGAAKGILPSLLKQHPLSISLWNRTPSKAIALAHQHHNQPTAVFAYHESEPTSFDLIINATSLGTNNADNSAQPLFFLKHVSHETYFYDLNYSIESQTPFIRALQEKTPTNHYSDGLGMLVEQAAEAFHIWTGLAVATEPVYKRLRQ